MSFPGYNDLRPFLRRRREGLFFVRNFGRGDGTDFQVFRIVLQTDKNRCVKYWDGEIYRILLA